MSDDGEWVYRRAPERQAFSLCRVTGAGTADEEYDLLGVVQVVVDRRAPQRLREQLRPWAVATLAAGGHGFGRYHAELGILDEDGEPDRALARASIDWSGDTVLMPAAGVPGAGVQQPGIASGALPER